MLSLLDFLPQLARGEVLERLNLPELILESGEPSQVSQVLLFVSHKEVQNAEVVIQTVANDYFVFQNTMTLFLSLRECNGTVLFFQVVGVDTGDPTAEVGYMFHRPHVLVHQDVTVVVDNRDTS